VSYEELDFARDFDWCLDLWIGGFNSAIFQTPSHYFCWFHQSAYRTYWWVASYRDMTFPILWKSKANQQKYIKRDRLNVLQVKRLLDSPEIGFVIHVVSGHHDDFVRRDRIRVKMVHQHAVNDSVSQWLDFCFVSLLLGKNVRSGWC